MIKNYPWLSPYYQQITHSFMQGHGHHGLLFKAESGLAIEQLIRALAHWLLCQNPKENQPCQQCHACHLIKAGNHPDFYLLAPIDNKDIGVEQVREVSEKLTQFAQLQGNKLVYIQGAERLTETAANALLKTLEEPPANSYFLLQANNSASLLPTIYSRCQAWQITPPTTEQALTWLAQQHQADKTELETALLINHGRPLEALAMLEQDLLAKRKTLLRQFWLFYSRLSPVELLPYFDKDIIFTQLDWIMSFLADSLKASLGVQQAWTNLDLAAGIEQLSQQQSATSLLKANQIMQQLRADLSQISGVNQELILLDGLTKLITEAFEIK